MAGGKIRDKDGLDERERVFVREYLIHQNAERAGLAAGYAKTTSATIAFGWATKADGPASKPHVYQAIRKVLDAKMRKLDITSERILEEIARVAFFNPLDVTTPNGKMRELDLSKLTDDQAAAIAEIWTEGAGKKRSGRIKTWNKLEALNMLAKYRNLFALDAPVTVNVNANVSLYDRVARASARAAAKDKQG